MKNRFEDLKVDMDYHETTDNKMKCVCFGSNNIIDKGVDDVIVIGDNLHAAESNKTYLGDDVTRDELVSIIKIISELLSYKNK